MDTLKQELKQLIIDSLGLEDITVDTIDDDQPLFGEGLGLDSVDSLELGLALQQRYGIRMDPEKHNLRDIFSSVSSLARFVKNQQTD